MIKEIEKQLIIFLNEHNINSNFILFSKKMNYSQLIEYNKNNVFNIIKECKNPNRTNIKSCDNKFLSKKMIDHSIFLTGYDWNKHKGKCRAMVINGIEFIGGDKINSLESINPIIEYDKLIK